jgi:uncharacterized membrane protein
MILNLAFSILVVLLFLYVVLSLFTIFHYVIFKNTKIIEVFFKFSSISVCLVFIIIIFFTMFKNLNIQFKL